ncbi:hypothetical protein CHU98_g806 [Xylaria longipes]|nr:hypothetical protein CHU98_g806 [Xylaria longipes]
MAAIRVAALLALVESLLVTRLMSYGLLPRYREDAFTNAIRVLATIFIANISSLILWRTIIDPTLRSPFRHLPKPKVGNSPNQTPGSDPRILISFLSIPNNGILAVWGVARYRLLLTNTDVTTELLVNRAYDFEKLENIRQFMTHLLGSGLVVLEGEPRKVLRKSSLQAFGHHQVQSLYPAMWDKALAFVEQMEKRRRGAEYRGCRGYGELGI